VLFLFVARSPPSKGSVPGRRVMISPWARTKRRVADMALQCRLANCNLLTELLDCHVQRHINEPIVQGPVCA